MMLRLNAAIYSFVLLLFVLGSCHSANKTQGKKHVTKTWKTTEKPQFGDKIPIGNPLHRIFDMPDFNGMLKYKTHQFEFKPDIAWADFAIKMRELSRNGSHPLNFTNEEVKRIFTVPNLDNVNTIKYFVNAFEIVVGNVSSSSNKWILADKKGDKDIKPFSSQGTKILADTEDIRLKEYDKNDTLLLDIQFSLGKKIDIITQSQLSEFKHSRVKLLKDYDIVFVNPMFELIAKGGKWVIHYKIFAYAAKKDMKLSKTFDKLDGSKAMQILTKLTYFVLSYPTLVENYTQGQFSMLYSYQDIIVSFSDYGFATLILNNTDVGKDKVVRVNFFNLIKTALINPFSIFKFNKDGDLKHKHHDVTLGELGQIADIGVIRGELIPRYKYSGTKSNNTELEKWITKRVQTISKNINDKGIDENNLDELKNWIIGMIKEDFEKFRTDGKKYVFEVTDEHFAAQTKLQFQTKMEFMNLDLPYLKKGNDTFQIGKKKKGRKGE